MYRPRAMIIALALVAAACGGDDSGDAPTTSASAAATTTTSTTEAPTTTTVASTTTVAPTTVPPPGPGNRPATSVTAILGNDPATETYLAFVDGSYDADLMGVTPGAATTEWFRAEGFYVAFFRDVDTRVTGPLCPGASIAVPPDFFFVSNAPTEGADCSGFVTVQDDASVRALECDGSLAYRTAIPDDQMGILFGTLEKPVGEGIMGITSLADSSAGEIPEVDIGIFEC